MKILRIMLLLKGFLSYFSNFVLSFVQYDKHTSVKGKYFKVKVY